MTQVQILLAPSRILGEFYFRSPDTVSLIREFHHEYQMAGEFVTQYTGQAAANEAFDLTNNPGREEEREEIYGRLRSISVGDIVRVDGKEWVCMSTGWKLLELGA
jgi:hypothetical protein